MSSELIRNVNAGDGEQWDDPVRGRVTFRTLLSSDITPSEGLTAGVAEVAPGDVFRPHRHRETEVYLVIEGEGTLLLDGAERLVGVGDVVYLPSGHLHGVSNTGDGSLRLFYVLDADGMHEVAYDFGPG